MEHNTNQIDFPWMEQHYSGRRLCSTVAAAVRNHAEC